MSDTVSNSNCLSRPLVLLGMILASMQRSQIPATREHKNTFQRTVTMPDTGTRNASGTPRKMIQSARGQIK